MPAEPARGGARRGGAPSRRAPATPSRQRRRARAPHARASGATGGAGLDWPGRLLDSRLAFLAGAPSRHGARLRRLDASVVALAASRGLHAAAAQRRPGRDAAARARGRTALGGRCWRIRPSRSPRSRSSASCCSGPGCVRALVRAEPLRVSPALAWAALLRASPSGSRCCSPPTRADGVVDSLRYALFIVFFFLVLQLTHTIEDVRRIVRVVVLSSTLAGGVGPLRLRRPRAHARRRADRGRQRLRLPDGVRAPARRVPARRARSRRRVLWGMCCVRAARRDAGDAVARRAGRARRTRAVGHHHAPRPGARRCCSASPPSSASPRSRSRCGHRCCTTASSRRATSRDKNVTSRQALWSAALRMAEDRPLTGVGPGRFGIEAPAYVRNNPIVLEKPVVHNSYLQVLAEIGALGLFAFVGVPRVVVAAARPLAKTGDQRRGRRRRATARDGDAGLADRGDRRRRVPERAAHDARSG